MAKRCVFFGHREIPEDLRERLEEAVEQAIADGVTEFWNGGYGGFDMLAARVVAELKEKHPQICSRMVYAYPPVHAPDSWFDQAFCPDILDEYELKARIPRRNIWMTEECDMAITYVNHDESRIHEPLDHMLKLGKPMVRLGGYEPRVRRCWWEEE